MPAKLSLVVPTLGRTHQLGRLLRSLDAQEFRDFELIVVDQNTDDRLVALLAAPQRYPVLHIRTGGERGASRARNVGWRRAKGEYVLFPDDDCWYPPKLLLKAMADADATRVDLLCGRATDETGKDLNGRYRTTAQWVSKGGVWTTQIEWMMFFRRDALEKLAGFDETIGVGANSIWQAAEGQDISLRALSMGMRCFYDPCLCGHHDLIDTSAPDEALLRKGKGYALGMGFVLGRAGYGPISIAYWTARALFNAVRAGLRGNRTRCAYFLLQARGRLEGWMDGRARRDQGPWAHTSGLPASS